MKAILTALWWQILEVQKRELEIRTQENINKKLEIESNERIALATIKAQAESDSSHSKTLKAVIIVSQIKWVLIALFVAVAVCIAFVLGYSSEAMEIAKYALFAVAGFAAGYGKCSIDRPKSNKPENNGSD
jgi:hypothetical protein